jgi:hypothetical protein
MRKLVIALMFMIAMALAGTVSVSAVPPTSPPGQGECDHGNSQQSCKPDPQPSNGQDCDEHGPKDGGVNEDHCTPEVTPFPTSTASTEPTSEPTPSASASTSPTPSTAPEPSATPSIAPTSEPSVVPTPSTTPSTTDILVRVDPPEFPVCPACPTPPSTDAVTPSQATSTMDVLPWGVFALFAAITFARMLGPKRR